MSLLEFLGLVAAGVGAGAASSMAGGASLVSFPILLAYGIPPLVANVSNTCGLVPTAFGVALAAQKELTGQRPLLRFLVPPAVLGGLTGTALLLLAPASAFEAVVPLLIGGSAALVLVQPLVVAHLRRGAGTENRKGVWLSAYVSCVYGGYFGAAAAVLFLGTVGLFSSATMHQLNAVKNIVMGIANGVALVVFAVLAPVNWTVAAALAIGSLVGGALGMRLARHIQPIYLRVGIGVIGLGVAVGMVVT